MEFRTEYDLTLSMPAGRALVKKLVEYHEMMLDVASIRPDVFEVPGVLRLENLVVIEGHSYESVPNPAFQFRPSSVFTTHLGQLYPGRLDPRGKALTEECSLRVKFVVWQHYQESVNT